MEKLDPQKDGCSKDIVHENIHKLQELFPDVFNDGKIDSVKLKELIGEYVDSDEERFNFCWHGKSQAKRIAQTPSTGTLLPCRDESIEWEETKNIFIEGDNLEALKLLQKSFHKKIKVVYIDPPYNTGKDFIYPDNYRDNLSTYLAYTGQKDSEGYKFSTNTEQSGRYHTNWLNMMYPRLKLARNLMADDAIIAVTIDDNELFQLGNIMDEIFGSSNRIACAPWLSEASGGKEKTGLRTGHEYILMYCKNDTVNITQEERSAGELNLKDTKGKYRKGRELMKWGGTSLRSDRPQQFYPLPAPDGTKVYPYRNDGQEGHWRWGQQNEQSKEAQSDYTALHWEMRPFDEGVTVLGERERWVPYEKIRDVKKSVGWSTWLDKYGTNADATRELKALFGFKPFDTPKPVSLIKWIINLHEDENAIVLDFFAGSSSTAQAVMDLNFEDGGQRRFVCVQLPEPLGEQIDLEGTIISTVADIGKERIRRSGNEISSALEGESDFDIGMKVFKLESSNIKAWDADFDNLEKSLINAVHNIKEDRTEEDVLYELLLKYGLDLTLPIEERIIAGKTVYSIGLGALVICLGDEITLEVVEGIGKMKEELEPEIMRVVFKDSGFKDVVKTNAIQTLKQYDIVDVKSL